VCRGGHDGGGGGVHGGWWLLTERESDHKKFVTAELMPMSPPKVGVSLKFLRCHLELCKIRMDEFLRSFYLMNKQEKT